MGGMLDALRTRRRRLACPPPPQAEPATGVTDLIEETERLAKTVQSALSRFEIRRSKRREAARSLVLGTLLTHLGTLSRLLRRSAPPPDRQVLDSLGQILGHLDGLITAAEGDPAREGFVRHAFREAAWELVLELRCMLLELGDTSYLRACLEEEQRLDQDPDMETRWSTRYETARLYELTNAMSGDGNEPTNTRDQPRSQAVEMLARLYAARSEADREYRAQETLRVVRVRWVAWFLGAALLAVAALYGLVVLPDPQSDVDTELAILLVAIALSSAALGGMLGSIRKLREEPMVSRSGEQPRYRWAFVAQLLISGTLGLAVLALGTLEILPAFQVSDVTQQVDWQDSQNLVVLSIYAFLAGFSEASAFENLQRWTTGGVAVQTPV
jgi:hypothetical protein